MFVLVSCSYFSWAMGGVSEAYHKYHKQQPVIKGGFCGISLSNTSCSNLQMYLKWKHNAKTFKNSFHALRRVSCGQILLSVKMAVILNHYFSAGTVIQNEWKVCKLFANGIPLKDLVLYAK